MDEEREGNLIIIGGAEDKKDRRNILKEICSKIHKDKDNLLVATVATSLPEEVGKEYKNIFESLGVKNISILDIQCRQDAYKEENLELINNAALVFFTGGDQLKITSLLGGTPLCKAILLRFNKGVIFVGTSAGASVMSNTMIVKGLDEESPRKCTLRMAPGLGLINGVIIDQHFAQRGRIGRLLAGIAQNPESLGIGIDEDTAIMVNENKEFQVIGSGAVYVIDGNAISYSNVSEQNPDDILSIYDVKVHVLKNGDKYNLIRRHPIKEENNASTRG